MGNGNCSFCGKRHHEVFRLIAGPSCSVCSECIGRMANMIATELQTVASKIIALPPAEPPLPPRPEGD
jgi:ATP-dependent Clp protease ATP-binding subunit ClpX